MKMKMKIKNGFTTTELLVAMSIALVSLTGGFMILEMGYKYLDYSVTLVAVQRDSRLVMERMFKELQESKAATVSIGTGSKSISFASARNSSTPPVFQFTSSGAPNWQKAIVYYLDSNTKKVYRYEETKTDWTSNYNPDSAIGNANAKELISNVTSLQFSTSSSLATVSTTVSKNTRAGKATESLSTTVKLRN